MVPVAYKLFVCEFRGNTLRSGGVMFAIWLDFV